jgi:single-stranded-DNA-specific exonuclease
MRWLDLVALGTVADVVRLDRNNRCLVAQGLKRIRAGPHAARSRARCSQSPDAIRGEATAADFGFRDRASA